MEPVWRPEREVDEDLARALVRRIAPELEGATFERFGEGFDNVAFLVAGQWVFRFPQREMAGALMAVESRILPALTGRLPVAVPVPTWAGRATDLHPWPYAGYPVLPGVTADRARLDDAGRASLAAPLGRFLRALHDFPADAARAQGAPPDLIRRMDVPYRVDQARLRLAEAQARGWLAADDYTPILDAVDLGLEARSDVLCHGDLYDRHLLVAPDGTLSGVIDWGDVHLGDPGVDLAVAHRVLPPAAHRAFLDAYGAVDEARWSAARARALGHAVATLFYARDVGDASLERGCLVSLAYLQRAQLSRM